MAGAPKGNRNATKNKPWSDSIRKRITQRKELDKLADKVIDMALEGDLSAMKEIGDRLEGKSTEHKHHSGSVSHDHSGLPSPAEILAGFAGESPDIGDEVPTTH